MTAIDMTAIVEKYAGLFVALSGDRKTVLGKGNTANEALEEAGKKGHKKPILTRIPEDNKSYIL